MGEAGQHHSSKSNQTIGLLGDTAERDYSRKLKLFNAFAAPELQQAIAALSLPAGSSVLDAGCGTGEALVWFADRVGPSGSVVGVDLSTAHVAVARRSAPHNALVLQADLLKPPLPGRSFDLIWSVNTINHLRHPRRGVQSLSKLLRTGGRIAIGQSSLLPDMYFAWNARLERRVQEAVYRYYRERYGLDEKDLAAVRALAGLLRQSGLRDVQVRTLVIERLSPLQAQDERYLLETIFQGTWGERIRPFLSETDYVELEQLCDPHHASFALRRADFHFVQTFTLAIGSLP